MAQSKDQTAQAKAEAAMNAQPTPDSMTMMRSCHLVNAVGRWVGKDLYWDIDGETISDAELKRWCRANLPEHWTRVDVIVNYHVSAYKHRREAIKAYLQERV